MTRQRCWQLKKQAKGLCSQCGSQPLLTKNACIDCARVGRRAHQKRLGHKAWKPGSTGAIPTEFKSPLKGGPQDLCGKRLTKRQGCNNGPEHYWIYGDGDRLSCINEKWRVLWLEPTELKHWEVTPEER